MHICGVSLFRHIKAKDEGTGYGSGRAPLQPQECVGDGGDKPVVGLMRRREAHQRRQTSLRSTLITSEHRRLRLGAKANSTCHSGS